jgi:hypothetical protein
MNPITVNRWLLILIITSLFSLPAKAQTVTWGNQVFRIDTLADHLGFPWEVTYGPDDSLWVTESRGYKVTKIHARNGGKRTILNIANSKNFNRPDITGGTMAARWINGLGAPSEIIIG